MNRDEITAKIAELEKKIQMDKLQKNGAYSTGSVVGSAEHGVKADSYALCLGGGGGKGAYQLGVYRALAEYGLMDKVTAISGTSIGACFSRAMILTEARRHGRRYILRRCLTLILI